METMSVDLAIEMIQKLKQENSTLKNNFVKEISALQMELAQLSAIKSIYEEKYNEIKLKLAYSESSLNEKFQESLLIKSLNMQIKSHEDEIKQFEEQKILMNNAIGKFKEDNLELRRKIDKLEGVVRGLKKENFVLKCENKSKGLGKSIEKKVERKTPILMVTSESQPRILDKTLIFNSTQSIRREYSMTRTGSQFIPSCMRTKSRNKTKESPILIQVRSTDQFIN